VAASVRDTGFGGWYGLEAYGVQQLVTRLARHHYRDTAATLDQAMGHDQQEPLVIGGRNEGVKQLLASLPSSPRERFAADAHTLIAARVRELAAPLVTRWAGQRTERLAGKCSSCRPAAWRQPDLGHAWPQLTRAQCRPSSC
jgi:hypothetical protein